MHEHEKYSEGKIRSILLADQTKLFEVISATKAYFNLSGKMKEYANMYLKFICLKAAAGILITRLRDFGLTENDEEQKTVVRVVYSVSLDFVKRFVNTDLIQFQSFHGIEERSLLLTTLSSLKRYAEDMEHFAKTGEPNYDTQKDSDGYFKRIPHIFIQETHEVKFQETKNGIFLRFHFDDLYDEYNLDDSIAKTLTCIRKLLLDKSIV